MGGGGAIAWEYTSATRYIERHTVALGDDGIPFTADDVIGFGRIRDIDENGGLRFDATLDGPGADGVWGTGDDELDDYTTRTFGRSGNLLTMVSYDGPGADGLWFTADDVVEFSGTYAQTPFAEVWRVAG